VDEGLVWIAGALTCAALLGARRRELGHPVFALLRVLLPSYRFFDDVFEAPTLRVRAGDAPGAGELMSALVAPARRARQLIWNPEGNLHLAHVSLLERLVNDLADAGPLTHEEARALPAHRMVERLAEERADAPGLAGAWLQFELRYGDEDDDVFLSAPYARAAAEQAAA
jgi:hypothetical protein